MASIAAAPPAEVVGRAPRAPSLWVLGTIALAGLGAAAYATTLGPDQGEGVGLTAALVGWIVLAYVACGLIAWERRPESLFGPLMVAAGFTPLLSRLREVDPEVPHTVGELSRLLPVVVFLHVFLAYPSGRLERRLEQAVVVGAYAAALGLGLVYLLLGGGTGASPLELVDRPGAAEVVLGVQRLAVAACALAGLGVLVARRRLLGRPLRRSGELLVDSFGLALVLMAVGIGAASVSVAAERPVRWVAFAMIGISPALFLSGLLRARLARSAVGELLVELRSDPAPADLRDALARTLGDPSLTLAYWLPEFGVYADVDGREVQLPDGDARRATTLIDRDGSRIAAMLHSPALLDEAELLDAATAAAAIALENARLHVELRARLEELRGSRARIVEAGHRERQRLERNLHDGAQQRLIALSLELSLLEAELADPVAAARLGGARREIAASLEELREIARGLHPAVVSGHGLDVALEQLAARAPVPVRLKVGVEGRLPEALEVAAYYVVAEALANVGKYAQASAATVDVSRANGLVVIEVVDDGVGGADTERGSGLRGLADRVEALDGRLRIWSPGGGGTRVQAEIPCVP